LKALEEYKKIIPYKPEYKATPSLPFKYLEENNSKNVIKTLIKFQRSRYKKKYNTYN
jgi:hypothetical protein